MRIGQLKHHRHNYCYYLDERFVVTFFFPSYAFEKSTRAIVSSYSLRILHFTNKKLYIRKP